MKKLLLLIALSGFALAQTQSLENTRWVLANYLQAERLMRAVVGGGATLEFAGGNISGNTGCNSFGGQYAQEDQKLTFSPLRATLRACPDEALSAQERAYTQHLTQVRGFTLERGVLRLNDEAGRTLLLFAQAQPSAIRGREWTVVVLNTGDAIASVREDTRLTATFGANGQMAGETGCNRYTLEGFTLKLGPAVSTQRTCLDEAAGRQEAAFLRALPRVAGFRITGNRLGLYDAEGKTLVSLTR